jgi:hypothetical protein
MFNRNFIQDYINDQKYLAVPASSVASVFGLCGQIEQK